jgi:CRP/FNR family transcriptional regulator
MGQTKSEIRAIVETDTKRIMISIPNMEVWTSKYRSCRNFVFKSYHNRLNEILQAIDGIAFDHLDVRLLHYLRDKIRINKETIIHNTHQEIAYEFHSSRVVISRLLKKLENLGKIEHHRNHIQNINLD